MRGSNVSLTVCYGDPGGDVLGPSLIALPLEGTGTVRTLQEVVELKSGVCYPMYQKPGYEFEVLQEISSRSLLPLLIFVVRVCLSGEGK